MAYIPPHKRNSNETEGRVPTPDKLVPLFVKNINIRPSNKVFSSKALYADGAILKWVTVGMVDGTQFPSSITLEPVEQRIGAFALMNSGGSEVKWDLPKSPWVFVANNALIALLESLENMRNEMESPNPKLEEVKTTLDARVGKVHFHRGPSVNLEAIRENLTPEVLRKLMKMSFNTHVPVSYTEKIVNEVIPNIGVEFESDKETYQVKLGDFTRPYVRLSCKCSVKEDGKMQLYKVELYQQRNMVMDISIPMKNLDRRLMLSTKRILTTQTDDEMQCIRDLIDSAIIDPDVKGGLRWPLEKTSSGKYTVIGVWHIRAKVYKNQLLRFMIRHADLFDFNFTSGEASWGINVRLKKVVEKLKEEEVKVSPISEMLKENMKFIWENFISCDNYLT